MEEWRDIEGFEGLYQVSNLGRVKSLNYHRQNKEKLLSQHIRGKYKFVLLYKNKTRYNKNVHRLVAKAFCKGYKEGYVVNHKDENKFNNISSNLEWVTPKENSLHSAHKWRGTNNYKAKKVMCVETGEIFNTLAEASQKLGVNSPNIVRSIKTGIKCGGYHWKYC